MATTPVDPAAVIVDWLAHLYDNIDTGWLTLFSQDRASGQRHTDWSPVDDYDTFTEIALNRARTCCVWWGVATRHTQLPHGRGGAADCDTIPALWVDIDVAGPNHQTTQPLPPSLDHAHHLLADYPLPATTVVATGGGLQAWWALTEPHPAADLQPLLERWGHTWAQLADRHGWHLDNVFDLARVMRLPGTHNRKTPDATLVEIITADWTHTYGIDDIDQHLHDPPAAPATTRSARVPYIGPARPGDAFNATRTGSDILQQCGWTLERQDRNGDQHWTRPGKDPRHGSSATVYADDGHTTIWSDAIPGIETKRPYDPFGLYTHLTCSGDFAHATETLAAQGYGTRPQDADDLAWITHATTVDPKSAQNGHSPQRRIHLTPAFKIQPRRVRWCWDQRLAQGTLGLLAGPEGLGKSTLAYTIAASLTRGDLPGEHHGTPRAVLVCATEDSWGHTIVPRLMAAGADLQLVYRIEVRLADDIMTGLSLPLDLLELEHAAIDVQAALFVLDPLMSRLDGSLDTHRDADVRQALEPLVSMADNTAMSILGLIHHNKSGSVDPLNVVMASKAFTAVARSVHTVIRDPDDDTELQRFFGTPKNNLGRADLPTLSFTIHPWAYDTDDGPGSTGRLTWGPEHRESIADILQRSSHDPEDKTALSEAAQWLEDYLDDRQARARAGDVIAAGRAAGHAERTIKRARKKLGIETSKTGFQGAWMWSLPNTAKGPQGAQDSDVGPLAPLASPGHKEAKNNKGAKGVSPRVREAPLESEPRQRRRAREGEPGTPRRLQDWCHICDASSGQPCRDLPADTTHIAWLQEPPDIGPTRPCTRCGQHATDLSGLCPGCITNPGTLPPLNPTQEF